MADSNGGIGLGTQHNYLAAADVPYGDDAAQKIDVYQPTKPNGAALLLLHGGGWWMGDKEKEASLASRLCQVGYLVAAANYRLADGEDQRNLYPTQVQDATAALAWLRGSYYNFDRARMAVVGGSSGGNLAVETGIGHGLPAVSLSGLLDLEGFMASHRGTTPRRAIIDASAAPGRIDQGGADDAYYKWLVINLLGGDMDRLHEATPIHRVTPATGPMFLAGSMHELVPAGEVPTMTAALVAVGVPVESVVLTGSRHAEAYLADVWDSLMDFLGRYLRA
jgi:acetyl esterase/lipase